jgi:hypothetical protein
LLLHPQLPHLTARRLVEERKALTVDHLAQIAGCTHPAAVYTPTGGTPAEEEVLRQLRDVLVQEAAACGYPHAGDDASRRRFDATASALLHQGMRMVPAEAANHGVWEFVCTVLLPDIVRWRFPGDASGTPAARFLAGRRNTFQRLWWRAQVMHDEASPAPYHLLGSLGEDEIVQIMERPNLAGIPQLTRAVAKEFLASATRHPGASRRDLIRDGQKRIMRLSAFLCLEALHEPALRRLASEAFEQAARRTTGRQPA